MRALRPALQVQVQKVEKPQRRIVYRKRAMVDADDFVKWVVILFILAVLGIAGVYMKEKLNLTDTSFIDKYIGGAGTVMDIVVVVIIILAFLGLGLFAYTIIKKVRERGD